MDTRTALLRRRAGQPREPPQPDAPNQGHGILRPLPGPPAAGAAAARREPAPQERVRPRQKRLGKAAKGELPRGPPTRAPPELPLGALAALLRACAGLGSQAVRVALPGSAAPAAPAPTRTPSHAGVGSLAFAGSAHPGKASEHVGAGDEGSDQRVAALFCWLARACAVHLAISWLRAASAPGLLASGAVLGLLGLVAALCACAHAALAPAGRHGLLQGSSAAVVGPNGSTKRGTAGRGAPNQAPGGSSGAAGAWQRLRSVGIAAEARLRGALHSAAPALVASTVVAGLLAAAVGGTMFLAVQVRCSGIQLHCFSWCSPCASSQCMADATRS